MSQLIYEALRNSDYDVAGWEDDTVRGLADFIAKEIADRGYILTELATPSRVR